MDNFVAYAVHVASWISLDLSQFGFIFEKVLSQDFESIQKVQHEFTNEIQSWNVDNLDAKSISEKIYKLYQKHEKKIN